MVNFTIDIVFLFFAAAVFKDKDIFDVFILADFGIALCPQVNQLFHVAVAQLCQSGGVPGRIEDNLALSVGRTNLEKVVGNIVRLRRILGQCREVVVIFEDLIVCSSSCEMAMS